MHLGLIIFQFGIYLYAKSGSSRMKNGRVVTILEGMGGEEGQIGLMKDFTMGEFRVNHISISGR